MRVDLANQMSLDLEIPNETDTRALKVSIVESADYVCIDHLVRDVHCADERPWECDEDAGVSVRPNQLDGLIEGLLKAREIFRSRGLL
jgi:hypothetical protein